MCTNCSDSSCRTESKTPELVDSLKLYLETLAQKRVWRDDDNFNISDYVGEHIDESYVGGLGDGEIDLARRLLKMFIIT